MSRFIRVNGENKNFALVNLDDLDMIYYNDKTKVFRFVSEGLDKTFHIDRIEKPWDSKLFTLHQEI